MTRWLAPRTWLVLGIMALLLIVGGVFVYVQLFREEPAPYFASDEEHFLYGSIGTEGQDGVPYWIWLVLPRIFPEYLPGPGGWASIGVLAVDGHEMPIGLSKVTVGFPRVGINCAICHTTSVRTKPDEVPRIYPAAPAQQMSPQMYLRFLMNCAADPRFSADTILAEIDKNVTLSPMERMLYRFAIIPQTRRALLQRRETESWMDRNPDWGKGRIDPFNPVKFRYLGQPIDQTIGNADMVPLWNLAAHQGYALHADGLTTSLQESVLSSAIGDGTPVKWVDRDFAKWNNTTPGEMSSLRRVQNYISNVQAPKYPYPVDATLAATGRPIYQEKCASCHEIGGQRTGSVVSVAEVGTDRHRLDMWTKNAAASYNAYGEGHAWKFSKFRTTDGYVTTPLEGLWLRAPYLHNGSVPSLVDLFEPVERRPQRFWRGYDLYDPVKVGFVSDGPEAQRVGTLFEIQRSGNSNVGHTYGVDLPAESKRALIEYLKTL